MKLNYCLNACCGLLLKVGIVGVVLATSGSATSNHVRRAFEYDENNPFGLLDPQNWANPDSMTWTDYKAIPGTDWSNPKIKGSNHTFNIALIAVDYPDQTFSITQPVGSTVFGNPQPGTPKVTRAGVPAFYRDFLNVPSDYNGRHTIHEYWKVGNAIADSFEITFILSAGVDESGSWQEFGEMKFQTKEEVPDAFGPPGTTEDGTIENYAKTRYVEWTSWAAAASIWTDVNVTTHSVVVTEASGVATYAHELTHLLDIGDNFNNPYGTPLRRSYTGPWSMMSRGTFNGPGGPHTRWHVPPKLGGSMGSHHTLFDKDYLGFVANESILRLKREALPKSGLAVVTVFPRSVVPSPGEMMGMQISMDSDLSPACDINKDIYCDGGGYNNYYVEVVDRMGSDSFTPDTGVMISKTKDSYETYQWIIDANPQDIELIDFKRPNGDAAYVTLGDYRQLADALFHAGAQSGSEFEYIDKANNLHFYIIDVARDAKGILSYTTAVRSLDSATTDPHKRDVGLGLVSVKGISSEKGVTCTYEVSNTGTFKESGFNTTHPTNDPAYFKSDVYRLSVEVVSQGWTAALPNELVTVEFGKTKTVRVAASSDKNAVDPGVVGLTVTSESNPSVSMLATCSIAKMGS
ncbi:unnamed protein product [Diplocarpon coronariae]